MTLPRSEVEQELRNLAKKAARQYGERVDANLHDWEYQFQRGRIKVGVTDNKGEYVRVSLRERDGHRWFAVIFDDWMKSECLYMPELYEVSLEELKRVLVLERLADV